MTSNVLVVGSINVDVVVKLHDIPAPGQTVKGDNPAFLPGGKGGNQAVSSAAAGAKTLMIGAVGSDDIGKDAISSLTEYGVETTGITIKPGPTGTAYIFVDHQGENAIVVVPGANGLTDSDQIAAQITSNFTANTVVLCQMELPMDIVERAAQEAKKLGLRFVLNLAPAVKISKDLLAECNPIVINETEAAFLANEEIKSIEDAKRVASNLSKLAKSVVITLGADGAVFGDGSFIEHLPSKKVEVVDTTGAGDAFVGALAAALSRSETLEIAVQAGLEAGAKAVQHFGAQPPKN